MKSTIAFDLDGTLLDTLGTIHRHLQKTLSAYGFKPIPLETTKALVGKGLGTLISDAVALQMNGTPESGKIKEMIESLVQSYQQDPFTDTEVYPGIKELIWELKGEGHTLVVTTNKDQTIAQEICQEFLPGVFALVLGPEPPLIPKPDPQMIQEVGRRLGSKPKILVGDSEVDLETAQNASIHFIPVSWGFRTWESAHLAGHEPVSTAEELKKRIIYLISGNS